MGTNEKVRGSRLKTGATPAENPAYFIPPAYSFADREPGTSWAKISSFTDWLFERLAHVFQTNHKTHQSKSNAV